MRHEDFPAVGFEFMNEPATKEQKELIVKTANEIGMPIDPDGEWPKPFTKWDALNMLDSLESLKGK